MKGNKNKLKYGAYSAIIIVVVLVVVLLLNIFVAMLSQKVDISVDMTSKGNNSASKENIEIIKKFDKDVNITVLCDKDTFLSNEFLSENFYIYDGSDGNYAAQAKRLFEIYERTNKHIKVKYVDSKSPEYSSILSKYSAETFQAGDILVESNGALKVVSVPDLFELEELTYYVGTTIVSSKMEATLTSAIIVVTGDDPIKAEILTSHNCDDSETIATLLKGNNFSVSELSSLETSDIDEETSMLIINSPTNDFTKDEIKKLNDFLNVDNHLLFYVADSSQPKLQNLEKYLKEWGVIPMDGVIFETNSSRYYNDNYLTRLDYVGDLYKDLEVKGLDSITYIHRPFELVDDNKDYTSKPLLQVPSSAILYPLDSEDQENFTQKNAQNGPFYGAILANKKLVDGESAIFAMGSKNFFTNQIMTSNSHGNANFLMLTLKDALKLEDTNIYFAPKEMNPKTGLVDANTANLIGTWLFMVILPATVLIFGLYNWLRRRAR